MVENGKQGPEKAETVAANGGQESKQRAASKSPRRVLRATLIVAALLVAMGVVYGYNVQKHLEALHSRNVRLLGSSRDLGLVNPLRGRSIDSLRHRGLVEFTPELAFSNERFRFREFIVENAELEREMEQELAERATGWGRLKWVVGAPVAAIAIFLFATASASCSTPASRYSER